MRSRNARFAEIFRNFTKLLAGISSSTAASMLRPERDVDGGCGA